MPDNTDEELKTSDLENIYSICIIRYDKHFILPLWYIIYLLLIVSLFFLFSPLTASFLSLSMG